MVHAPQETVLLRPGKLDLASLRQLAGSPAPVRLADGCWAAVEASARALERYADSPLYDVNTGFGKLASQRIAGSDLARLQVNLLRSHAVGVGEPLPPRVVRLVLLLTEGGEPCAGLLRRAAHCH